MNVTRVGRIEQHEKSALFVGQTTIELDHQPVRFFAGQIVVMNGDPLPRQQVVRYDRDLLGEIAPEELAHCRAQAAQGLITS